MKIIRIVNEEFNCDDCEPITDKEEQFADNLFDLIQSLVIHDNLNEVFTSEDGLKKHFFQHCIADKPERKSKRSNIYYDFTDINKYREYEKSIANQVLDTDNIVTSLYDTKHIYKLFRNLFKGGESIYFTTSCGFSNTAGPVSIGINAYASNYTKNYSSNTVNFLVITGRGRTITMYPIDAHYLETKLNNLVKDFGIEYKYNND